jgi:TetR/AcrR family transcriptional regulator, transcriptional repressor for nem operon
MPRSLTTADDIITRAQSLILAGGYNGFSYADIAEVVGVRKASIHHHFPSKIDLVRTLLERYRAEAKAGFDFLDAVETTAAQSLGHYLDYWRRCLAEGTAPICICALLASELPALPPEIAAQVRLHFKTLAAWLEATLIRGREDGSLALTETPRAEAEAFMAAVHGAMLSARVAADPKTFDLVATALLDRLKK